MGWTDGAPVLTGPRDEVGTAGVEVASTGAGMAVVGALVDKGGAVTKEALSTPMSFGGIVEVGREAVAVGGTFWMVVGEVSWTGWMLDTGVTDVLTAAL